MSRLVGDHIEEASRWIYRGVWRALVKLFRVPEHPPELPLPPGEALDAFRPATGFLRYLKLWFWIVIVLWDGLVFVVWLAICIPFPAAGAVLALPALVLAAAPGILAYIAIHLQYDTTWYVMSRRSLRIRRGIWTIHETTITFENIQNVQVNQGPVQRAFGIADVQVDTAGGGGQGPGKHGGDANASHCGLIQGVSDAPRIRDLILARLGKSRTAGLGDERHEPHEQAAWSPRHVEVLREIRDLARGLATAPRGTA